MKSSYVSFTREAEGFTGSLPAMPLILPASEQGVSRRSHMGIPQEEPVPSGRVVQFWIAFRGTRGRMCDCLRCITLAHCSPGLYHCQGGPGPIAFEIPGEPGSEVVGPLSSGLKTRRHANFAT